MRVLALRPADADEAAEASELLLTGGTLRPASSGRRPARTRASLGSSAFKWLLRLFGICYVGLLVGVPVGSVVWRALSPGLASAVDAVTSSAGLHALWLTLEVTALAVACNTVFGLGVALILARRRFPGASVLEALIDLPLSLSPVVVGLALLLFWSSTQGWARLVVVRLGFEVLFSFPGIVLASAFISLPYVVREVLPVLVEIGTEQEQAAHTLGAGSFYTFGRITLPSIRWGLAYGVVLTAARVLGEFGAVSVVSGDVVGRTQTLTLYVNSLFQNYDYPGAYAGALLLALISLCLLGLLSLSRRRRAVT
ncbi:MAG TPA: sulfate ABC transporter permease subunit [Acidimicrobiales bacterium]|nr:sulfate ABC transporter permease subunit [Acidimicrobiales bacterium]